jgi:hypothetical protein
MMIEIIIYLYYLNEELKRLIESLGVVGIA